MQANATTACSPLTSYRRISAGLPQIRTRTENTVQQRDATLPGGDLDPGPGPHLDQNVLAGYAKVALASILDPSSGLFSDAARPGQCPFSYWAQTWHSKIAIRDESQK